MKTNESQKELDEAFSMASGGDYNFSIKIEKGSTRRQTFVTANRQLMCFLRKVDLEALKEHYSGTRARASRSTFEEAIEKNLEENKFEWRHIQNLELDIEGLVESNSQVPQEWVEAYIDKKYKENFKKVEEALEKRDKADKLREEKAREADE